MTSHPTPESQPAAAENRFSRDKSFDAQFDMVKDLIWYPYIGKHFGVNGARIMVYGHNAYVDTKCYAAKKSEWEPDKAAWSDYIDEYTYDPARYTNAFRSFIKGAVGLQSKYYRNSAPSIIERVDSFVKRIAFCNFIQAVVKSDNALALAEPEQI